MEPAPENALPAHRIALRAVIAAAVTGVLAGGASAIPYLSSHLHWDPKDRLFLPIFNAFWIAIRVALLTSTEEIARAQPAMVRAFAATALLFFLSPFLENWAMHWAGALVGGGTFEDPLEGLIYALDRASPPSLSSGVGKEQARMTAPFIALAFARTRFGPFGCFLVYLVVSVLVFAPAVGGRHVGLACTMFLLPAPVTVLALQLAVVVEERVVACKTGGHGNGGSPG